MGITLHGLHFNSQGHGGSHCGFCQESMKETGGWKDFVSVKLERTGNGFRRKPPNDHCTYAAEYSILVFHFNCALALGLISVKYREGEIPFG